MIRLFYRCILRLHPARFRERFAAEMLEIFDEAKGAASFRILMADALISLIRQWLLRKRAWVGIAAVAFAGLQYWFLGLMYHFPTSVLKHMRNVNRLSISTEMRLLIIVPTAGVVLLAGAASLQTLNLLYASRRMASRLERKRFGRQISGARRGDPIRTLRAE
jgi:hypothetical protein